MKNSFGSGQSNTTDVPPTLPVTRLKDWVRSAKPLHKKGGKVTVRMPGQKPLVVQSMQDIDPKDIPQ